MPLFGRKEKIKPPTKAEKLSLANSRVKFVRSEIQNHMESSHGSYYGSPKREDLAAAHDLMKLIEPRGSISLIGELRVVGDEVALFFRGRRIDTLSQEAAEKVKAKLTEPAPILFVLSHIVSNDKSRHWPSIVLKQGRTLE